ncbi:hypothetical protein FRC09_018610 [Ceratobasidium sp. 395]|nr:hypothetical protein FRC09_018610 [Ceratobasidium sp. 395]
MHSFAKDITAQQQRKRRRPVGHLIPDVLFNHEEIDFSQEGTGLAVMLDNDSRVDLLLVVGTSLRTDGLFKIVKLMAQSVHAVGGAVVYVDRCAAGSRLSGFMDMHFQMDIDAWSSCMLSVLTNRVRAVSGHMQDQVIKLGHHLSATNRIGSNTHSST